MMILTYTYWPAVYLAYNPLFPNVAEQVANLILAVAPFLSIEHIGSTAIAGCSGKGIIDLAVLYPSGNLEATRNALDGLGFQRQTTRDPFPESRPMRVGAIEFAGSTFQIHVHAIALGSPEHYALVGFRDYLRSNSDLRLAYQVHKQLILESGVTDSAAYSVAKTDFIKSVLDLLNRL